MLNWWVLISAATKLGITNRSERAILLSWFLATLSASWYKPNIGCTPQPAWVLLLTMSMLFPPLLHAFSQSPKTVFVNMKINLLYSTRLHSHQISSIFVYGGTGDLHHGREANKSAVTVWCYCVNMGQSLWGMHPTWSNPIPARYTKWLVSEQ